MGGVANARSAGREQGNDLIEENLRICAAALRYSCHARRVELRLTLDILLKSGHVGTWSKITDTDFVPRVGDMMDASQNGEMYAKVTDVWWAFNGEYVTIKMRDLREMEMTDPCAERRLAAAGWRRLPI